MKQKELFLGYVHDVHSRNVIFSKTLVRFFGNYISMFLEKGKSSLPIHLLISCCFLFFGFYSMKLTERKILKKIKNKKIKNKKTKKQKNKKTKKQK
jgi:amino acid permease